jgi:hypothetical protein
MPFISQQELIVTCKTEYKDLEEAKQKMIQVIIDKHQELGSVPIYPGSFTNSDFDTALRGVMWANDRYIWVFRELTDNFGVEVAVSAGLLPPDYE